MGAFKLENFSGLIPRTSPRLLPAEAATVARNTKLLQGEARGYRSPRVLADFTSEYFTVRRAYRIPRSGYDDVYLLFDSRDVDIVRSPVINEQFDRYYWAGDGAPKYNTLTRIANDLPEYLLGIPQPDTTPTVTPPAAGDSSRAYVYTFVSAFGEEGPPSEALLTTGSDASFGPWEIGNLDTSPADASQRNITRKKIYRTVAGQTSSNFYFVGEVDISSSNFFDHLTDAEAASNNLLESTSWFPPPEDMEGFVSMPNGYLVGWSGRRLLFSEQYQPHAWPPEFELATEFEIVGLVVWGQTLIIGTQSNPYMGQGATPAAFTLQKMDAVEPCLSRRGMVATVAGAYYPSINGLVLANSNGTTIVTQDLLTKEEWAGYDPASIYASQLGLQYIAFNSPSFGFIFNPTEDRARFVELDRFDDVEGIETDRYTGNVNIIRADRLWDWDPEGTERLFWRWKSKVFHLAKPVNFGAAKLKFVTGGIDVSADIEAYYQPYNEARFALPPLSTIAGHAICALHSQGYGQVPSWTEPEISQPIGGSSLYPLTLMSTQQPGVRLIVYANNRVKFDKVVTDEKMIRLPAGFKSDIWQFELVGNTNCYSLQVAETGKGLDKA